MSSAKVTRVRRIRFGSWEWFPNIVIAACCNYINQLFYLDRFLRCSSSVVSLKVSVFVFLSKLGSELLRNISLSFWISLRRYLVSSRGQEQGREGEGADMEVWDNILLSSLTSGDQSRLNRTLRERDEILDSCHQLSYLAGHCSNCSGKSNKSVWPTWCFT